MIKGTFTQDAGIGEHYEPKYRFQVSKEHASQLYRILRETHMTPADWFASVIAEELKRIGYRVEIPDQTNQLTITGTKGANDAKVET
jgi:hypothetical protein